MHTPIKTALAGFGLAGRILHSPLLKATGFDVRHVLTSRANQVSDVWPDAVAVSSFDDLIAEKPELLVIATPSHLHSQQARQALETGIPVLVDKPLGVTAAEVSALADLSRTTGTRLTVFQNRRWDADFLTLKRAIENGEVGKPIRLVSAWHRHRNEIRDRWREKPGPGAGVFIDLGAHLIDQAVSLFGSPDWVQADIWSARSADPAAVDDSFLINFGYQDGLRVQLSSSSLAAGPSREIRLDGTNSSLILEGFDPQEPQLRDGMAAGDSRFGSADGYLTGERNSPDNTREALPIEPGNWLELYATLAEALRTGSPLPVTSEEALTTAKLIDLSRESSTTGKRLSFK